MLYQVRAIPNSKRMSIEEDGSALKVKVDAPPAGGKANRRLIEILAAYFEISPGRIKIVKGHASRNKIVEVNA